MLIKQRDLQRIVTGEITLAFRRWKRPTVKRGGALRTPIGVLAIDAIDEVRLADITPSDARRAGFESLAALQQELSSRREGRFYRIALSLAGPDPRIQLRQQTKFTSQELQSLSERLARLDRASRRGAWTKQVLQLIARRPATLAAELAQSIDRDTASFKADVRKLKNLGLTESLARGYRLSPRGKAVLKQMLN
jgi:exonuclease VII large subunit